MLLEQKRLGSLEVKADKDNRIIKGYASVFNNVDSDGDLIEPGAFAASIANKFEPGGRSRIKMMSQHDTFIGLPVVLREDDRGLYVEGKVSRTPAGDEALELVADGVWDEMSIGFITKRHEIIHDEKERERRGSQNLKRVIKEVDLWEFGPLAWGANPHTTATAQKAQRVLSGLLQIEKGASLTPQDLANLRDLMMMVEALIPKRQDADRLEEEKKQAVTLMMGITADLGELVEEIKTL